MKPAVLLVALLLLTRLAGAGPITYLDLVAAEKARTVAIAARAQSLGPDNLHCTITNLTRQEVRLRIPPGLRFEAADAGAQDIFTFQQKLLVLAPGASQQVGLWAFCMEKHNYSPAASSGYAFRGLAGEGLQPLGDSLQKYPALAEGYGQMFVWALSDHEPLYDMRVVPALLRGANNIVRYLSSVTGQPACRVRSSTDSRPTVKTFSKRAFLLYHSPTAQVATLKVYDAEGHEKYELLKGRKLSPGVVHYTFGINETVDIDANPVFTFRLLDPAGRVLSEMKVDKNTTEHDVEPSKVLFYFPFALTRPLKKARFRVRLPDGTLVEELMQQQYLPLGKFRYQLAFNHLYPPGTAFVVKLENEAGEVLRELPVENVAPH
jgi:hypothetical protein